MAGDVSHEDVRKHLNRFLRDGGRDARRGTTPERKMNMNRPRVHPGVKIVRRDLEQAHLIVGFPGLTHAHEDRFAAFLLNIYLGGGMSSALFQEIREKRGLAYTVYSSLAPFSDAGLFSMYVGTSPSEVGTCLEVVGRALARLRTKKLEERAIDVLKDNLKGTILLNSDSVENRMTSIAKNEIFFGRYFSTREVTRAIERVTAADVHRMARKLLKPEQLILTLMGPGHSASRARQRILKHF
ncbi:MAG: insulinase family protein [Deltaproteobacteria bacterium]|nr:insulinase family protein [Deltaproteobacteria bacterium]